MNSIKKILYGILVSTITISAMDNEKAKLLGYQQKSVQIDLEQPHSTKNTFMQKITDFKSSYSLHQCLSYLTSLGFAATSILAFADKNVAYSITLGCSTVIFLATLITDKISSHNLKKLKESIENYTTD